MQRRWAAICLAFFLVTAAGSYAVMAVAEEPAIDVDGDAYQSGETLQANGTTYTVTVEGGSGSLTYNETVTNEETFANESSVEYRNGSYAVAIGSADDPDAFDLVEEFDVEAMLAADPEVENGTYTNEDGGGELVRYHNGTTQPLAAYLPESDRETFAESETIDHGGETKTVDNVTASEALLTWETEEEQSITLAEGENATVEDTTYVATFPSSDTVVLSSDVQGYQQQESNQEYFQQRLSGLNYVVIFSLGSALLLAMLAFVPRRG